MYLSVDIGASKTLLAVFSEDGKLLQNVRFETPRSYEAFIDEVKANLPKLEEKSYRAACVAIPGLIDREQGIGVAFGNLDWKNVPIQKDFEELLPCPVVIENDCKLAALSEALLLKDEFSKVLYITISTGISAGLIVDGIIDPEFADSESGHMLLEHEGKLVSWESFASGKAIVEKYGKRASELDDKNAWKDISRTFAAGIINLIAIVQPEIILIGGGVGTHFNKFGDFLKADLKEYETPLTPIPPIRRAERPEEAVLYGCYELVKRRYGSVKTA